MLLLLTKMLEKEEKNLNGYCIDGYPRTEEQLDQFKQKVRVSISLISSRRFKFCRLTSVVSSQLACSRRSVNKKGAMEARNV